MVPVYDNIKISNVNVNGAQQAVYVWALPHVPLQDLSLTDVTATATDGATSINANNVSFENVQITPSSGATYTLDNSTNFTFDNVKVPNAANPFLHVEGTTSGIQLNNTDYGAAAVPFQLDPGIDPSVLTVTGPGSLTTTAVTTPAQPDGQNGWYVHSVTVSLSATDQFSDVASTVYSLDGGATWLPYNGPFTISNDGTSTVTFHSTDKAGIVEPSHTVTVQLDQTQPTIDVTGQADGSYADDQSATVAYTVSDAGSGVNNSSITATLDGQPVANGDSIALYTLPLGQHVLTVTAADNAGNVGTKTITFTTTTSLSSLEQLVQLFHNSQGIDNDGIANSLMQKLQNNDLQSFINEVNAQNGKHISSQAATYLLRDAQDLLNQ